MNASLVMFKADGSRRDFPITKERVVVGRKNDCDLRIPLTSVSRQHCEFRVENQIIKLKDLGSSNGTYHNNTRVQEVTLSAGDEVIVGPVVFTLVVDNYPEDIQPVRTIVDSHGSNSESPQLTTVGSAKPMKSQEAEAGAEGEDGDEDMTPPVDPEKNTPTVDLDDDPIAAMERMTHEQDDDSEIKLLDDEDDSSSR